MNMIGKGQLQGVNKGDSANQAAYIAGSTAHRRDSVHECAHRGAGRSLESQVHDDVIRGERLRLVTWRQRSFTWWPW